MSSFREEVSSQRGLRQRYLSTMVVLQAQRTRRAFALLKMAVARSQISSLRMLQADQQTSWRLKLNTLRAFALYSVASKRRKALISVQKSFRRQTLNKHGFFAFLINIRKKKEKIKKLLAARHHYRTHFYGVLATKVFYVLSEYAKHERN